VTEHNSHSVVWVRLSYLLTDDHVVYIPRASSIPTPTIYMTNHGPPQLELPSAVLHVRSQREPHVDYEEAVQHERRRVSRELEPILHHDSSRPCHTSLRSRNASSRDSTASREHSETTAGDESTAPDLNHLTTQSTTSSITSRWHTPITSFWFTHISLTIDSNAHRDHLGTSHSTSIFSSF